MPKRVDGTQSKKKMYSWPWTVTWNGRGRYFATKQKAKEAVKYLQDSGIKNIDVSCMQINLMYHPNAFRNLEEAFNPESNIDYATRFLRGLHRSTNSWIQAAANYHSTNPLLNLNYQTKLLKIWRKVSGISLNRLRKNKPESSVYAQPTTRKAQLALLNSRFRARLEAERKTKKKSKTKHQLDEWRKSRLSPNLLASTAAKNKALILRKQKSEILRNENSFEKKRLNQLAKWRKDRYFFQK